MSDSSLAPDGLQFCPWAAFDAVWYAATHMRHLGDADPWAHYQSIGVAAGFGPNPYFDETWYLRRYPDVAARVKRGAFASGFAHYCEAGLLSHDPHWLFSESLYRGRRGDLPDAALKPLGLRNGYHHYLIAGQNENVSGSAFFDIEVFAESTAITDRPFSALVATPELATLRLSRYFDPEWYLAINEEAVALIAKGVYSSALHHYLTCPEPGVLQGSADFDEAFYRTTYPDIAASIAAGRLRWGYQHYLGTGRFEGRRPSPWFDPGFYGSHRRVVADLAAGLALTAFDHFITIGRRMGLATLPPVHTLPVAATAGSEAAGKDIFARMAHLHASTLRLAPAGSPKLAMPDAGETPDVSVVIAAFNQFELTAQTLVSLSGSTGVRFEVILVDNGSTDDVRRIEAFVGGLRLVRNAENLGFLVASNQGIAAARGRHVLLLNNDVTLPPNALSLAVRRLDGDATIGAVGAKVVRTHGMLQEAGSLLFRDGGALGYGRDGDPAAAEYNFLRDVDYCSGVFLMVRAETLRRLGGFDPIYIPAYYEETDLCVRIWKLGQRVVYDPQVSLIHLEYGSSRNPDAPRAQMARNKAIFLSRHKDWLADKPKPDVAMALAGRITSGPEGRKPRVLVIEDIIPYRHLGSGFVRSADVVASLVSLGWQVTVMPMNPQDWPANRRAGFDERVELLWDHTVNDAPRVFAERELLYDAVWVCRAHNLHRLASVLGGDWGPLRTARVVLDTEALAANREAAQALLEDRAPDPDQSLAIELGLASVAATVVAVNAAEAAQVTALGIADVRVLGHAIRAAAAPHGFAERRDILALGSLYGTHTPNFDGLRWFIAQVWPLVLAELPEVRLLVAGYVAEDLDVARLLSAPGVEHLGPVAEPAALYEAARLFLAPTRFAAGIPYKVHEAAAHGLPVVCTTLLAGQLGWSDGVEVLARAFSDPVGFAAAVVAGYRDPDLWGALRAGALARIEVDCSEARFTGTIGAILAEARDFQ